MDDLGDEELKMKVATANQPLHLFKHSEAGYYVAESVAEATALLIRDGFDPTEAEGFEQVPDEVLISVTAEDDLGTVFKLTAAQWAAGGARGGERKGYAFGGSQ